MQLACCTATVQLRIAGAHLKIRRTPFNLLFIGMKT